MESQQMVELLLSMETIMEANTRALREDMKTDMKTNQNDLLKTVKGEI
jgi:hypothetical protein